MKNIVNIIHFVRAVEPREGREIDLPGTLREELELGRKYGFPATVLLQYDALILPEYIALLEEYRDQIEAGLWLEVVQPMAEEAGIPWRGRWAWDWHTDFGFLVGYLPEERKRLIDVAFQRFREILGYFPQVAGSWHIDAFSLAYMKERYGIAASCNCKDQYGTDGYTMWGGYYNGAYYPSRMNMLCPAQTRENQIDVPVFRMLGADPIHQYDLGLGEPGGYNPSNCQGVASMESVYAGSGGSKDWVRWYLDENFNGKSLSLAYTQVGQENSFGWQEIEKGLCMQYELLKEYAAGGKIELMTLGESGRWFSGHYAQTPPAAMCIDRDHGAAGNKTVWYNDRFYRLNLLYQDGMLWVRDLYLFDEHFAEKYLEQREPKNQCAFYNLPVMDGFRFSLGSIRAGLYPCQNGQKLAFSEEPYWSRAEGNDTVCAGLGERLCYCAQPGQVGIRCTEQDWYLAFAFAETAQTPYREVLPKELRLSFAGGTENPYAYSLRLKKGRFVRDGQGLRCLPEDGEIILLAR